MMRATSKGRRRRAPANHDPLVLIAKEPENDNVPMQPISAGDEGLLKGRVADALPSPHPHNLDRTKTSKQRRHRKTSTSPAHLHETQTSDSPKEAEAEVERKLDNQEAGDRVQDQEEEGEDDDEVSQGTLVDTTSRAGFCAHWLTTNFELREGVSVPRSALYGVYQHTCTQEGKPTVNAATFGKIIRMVWPTVSTRRLGTRGNSKYHYYGIGPLGGEGRSPAQPADGKAEERGHNDDDNDNDDDDGGNNNCSGVNIKTPLISFVPISPPQPRHKKVHVASTMMDRPGGTRFSEAISEAKKRQRRRTHRPFGRTVVMLPDLTRAITSQDDPDQSAWGPEDVEAFRDVLHRTVLNLASPDPMHGPLGGVLFQPAQQQQSTAPDLARLILHTYQEHCVYLWMLCCRERAFPEAVQLTRAFWTKVPDAWAKAMSEDAGLQRLLLACDDRLYLEMTERLVPHVMGPMSAALNQQLRRFVEDLLGTLADIPPSSSSSMSMSSSSSSSSPQSATPQSSRGFWEARVDLARQFAGAIRQRCTISHLAQAVRALLEGDDDDNNNGSVEQMLEDWMRHVHLEDVVLAPPLAPEYARVDSDNDEGGERQQAWLTVQWAQECIVGNLRARATLAEWTLWVDSLVEHVLQQLHHQSARHPPSSPYQAQICPHNHSYQGLHDQTLLLHWGLYTAYVSLQLTLHSASSFGAWHLLGLLMHEYVQFVLARRAADQVRAFHLFYAMHGQHATASYSQNPTMHHGSNNVMASSASLESLFQLGFLQHHTNQSYSTVTDASHSDNGGGSASTACQSTGAVNVLAACQSTPQYSTSTGGAYYEHYAGVNGNNGLLPSSPTINDRIHLQSLHQPPHVPHYEEAYYANQVYHQPPYCPNQNGMPTTTMRSINNSLESFVEALQLQPSQLLQFQAQGHQSTSVTETDQPIL